MPVIGLARSAALIGLLSLVAWLTVACGSSSLEVATPTPPSVAKGESLATTVAGDTPTPVQPTEAVADPPTTEPEVITPETVTDTPAAPEPGPPTGAPVTDAPLTLQTAVVKLDAESNPSTLANDDRLASCPDPANGCENLYGLYFIPDQDAYIYALQQDSTQKIDTLFPNEVNSEQGNPVPAGTTVWVPKDIQHWFYLDENIGDEMIFVVASTERIEELEELIAENSASGGSVDTDQVTAELAAWLSNESRGQGGITEVKKPINLPDPSNPDPPPPEPLDVTVVKATGDQGFVHAVEFLHVAPGGAQ